MARRRRSQGEACWAGPGVWTRPDLDSCGTRARDTGYSEGEMLGYSLLIPHTDPSTSKSQSFFFGERGQVTRPLTTPTLRAAGSKPRCNLAVPFSPEFLLFDTAVRKGLTRQRRIPSCWELSINTVSWAPEPTTGQFPLRWFSSFSYAHSHRTNAAPNPCPSRMPAVGQLRFQREE